MFAPTLSTSTAGTLGNTFPTGVGILGFTRFILGYSVVLIKERQLVCSLDGHGIYSVKGTEVVRISKDDLQRKKASWLRSVMNVGTPHYTPVEERYHALFEHALDELGKDFFFSYTYDATKHLQHNCASVVAVEASAASASSAAAFAHGRSATGVGADALNFSDRFCWNQFLLAEFMQLVSGWSARSGGTEGTERNREAEAGAKRGGRSDREARRERGRESRREGGKIGREGGRQ
jgi:hypothetical protein